MITINVTTYELFRQFADSMRDCIFDNKAIPSDYISSLKGLFNADINAIRTLFKDGYTGLLVDMEFIDGAKDEVEIRVFNEDNKLIGVIIDSEICY